MSKVISPLALPFFAEHIFKASSGQWMFDFDSVLTDESILSTHVDADITPTTEQTELATSLMVEVDAFMAEAMAAPEPLTKTLTVKHEDWKLTVVLTWDDVNSDLLVAIANVPPQILSIDLP